MWNEDTGKLHAIPSPCARRLRARIGYRELLADFEVPAHFALRRPGHPHESAPRSDGVRQSLLDDLQMSDGAK
jgi:hypothetical protein